MWNRKDVKAKGKASFKANFWKCVATALILAMIGGGMGSSYSAGSSFSNFQRNSSSNSENSGIRIESDNEDSYVISGILGEAEEDEDDKTVLVDEAEITADAEEGNTGSVDEESSYFPFAIIGVILLVSFVIFMVAMVIGFVFDAFIINPIELGCRRFFRKNLDEPAGLSNLMFAFDTNYKNVVKTMFFRDLYITLWSFLFIIPGIIKKYEYRMIPYLLSEDPTMSKEEAFAESKRLMTGNKWKTFVLDLSFILWDFASMFTCGLVGVFYVNPYKQSTDAALYEALKYGTAEAK